MDPSPYTRIDGEHPMQIAVRWLFDDSPDLSYLHTTVEQHLKDLRSWWATASTKDKQDLVTHYKANGFRHNFTELSPKERLLQSTAICYHMQDAERLHDHEHDRWCMMGCLAEGHVVVNGVIQTLSSGGLWGIESDSSPEYKAEIESEQIHELQGIITALGLAWPPDLVIQHPDP